MTCRKAHISWHCCKIPIWKKRRERIHIASHSECLFIFCIVCLVRLVLCLSFAFFSHATSVPWGYSNLTGCGGWGHKWMYFISWETLKGDGSKRSQLFLVSSASTGNKISLVSGRHREEKRFCLYMLMPHYLFKDYICFQHSKHVNHYCQENS